MRLNLSRVSSSFDESSSSSSSSGDGDLAGTSSTGDDEIGWRKERGSSRTSDVLGLVLLFFLATTVLVLYVYLVEIRGGKSAESLDIVASDGNTVASADEEEDDDDMDLEKCDTKGSGDRGDDKDDNRVVVPEEAAVSAGSTSSSQQRTTEA